MVEEHKRSEEVHDQKDKTNNTTKILAVIIGILLLFAIYNGYKISNLKQVNLGGSSTNTNQFASILPKGMPNIYGAELGVSFDDISTTNPKKADETIRKLGVLDNQITLTGKNIDRYIEIASKISCEYCCGVNSIIVTNEEITALNNQIKEAIKAGKITEAQASQYRREAGTAACGCAHSYAMRGLAKYLIKNHGTEFSDNQILEELGKWKVLFFPDVHMQKAAVLKQQGIELNYINLASNLYRGIEKGASGGSMVGGC